MAGESLPHDPMVGLHHLRGVFQPKLFHNSMIFLHALGSVTEQQQQSLFISPSKQQVSLFPPTGDDNDKDCSSISMQQRSVPLLLPGNPFKACVLHWLVGMVQHTPSIPTLFWHSAATVKQCWMQWYMLTGSLNISLLLSNDSFLKPLVALTPQHKQAFHHYPMGQKLSTGGPEQNSSQESCRFRQSASH